MKSSQKTLTPLKITIMNLSRYKLLVSFIIFFAITANGSNSDKIHQKDQILIIHSYHQGLKWTDNINKGICDVLNKYNKINNYEICIEYLDGKRSNDTNYFNEFYKNINTKYLSKNIAVVLTSDDIAFTNTIKHQNNILQNAPIVFCGLNHFDDYENSILQNNDNYTGVVEGFNLLSTIQVALNNHPNGTRLLIINDNTPTGVANKNSFEVIKPKLDTSINFEFIEPFAMENVDSALAKYGSETIILLLSYNKDSKGHYFSYKESGMRISEASNLPIYVVWDFYLPHQVVGGMVVSGELQGKTAAELAIKIIENPTQIRNLPVIKESPNKNMFNYPQLAKHNISIKDLPQDSTILKKPSSFVSKYLKELIILSVFIIFLIVVIAILTIINRKKTIAEQRLYQSRNKLSTILETANEGFIEFDKDGIITRVNYEACNMLNFERYSLLNRSLNTLIKLNKSETDTDLINNCYNGEPVSFELKVKDKNNTIKYLVINGTPIFSPDNSEIAGAFALISDITELKNQQLEILKSKQIAEQSDKLKSAFLANMSHEIRTPMNAIIGFSELLDQQKLTGKERSKYINIIKKSGKQLLALINDILDISKIEAGELTICKSKVNVNALLIHLSNTFIEVLSEVNKSHIALIAQIPEKQIYIHTDEIRITQIFSNLIYNSIKFTTNGSIKFGCKQISKNSIEFYVEDTGVGISEKQQNTIFERFIKHNTDKEILHPGIGLGLAISKHLTELLGGKIYLNSTQGKGTTFYFTIQASIYSEENIGVNNIIKTNK